MATARTPELSELEKVGCYAMVAPMMSAAAAVVKLYAVFVNGFVLAHLWSWYAVPLGLRPLGWTVFGAVLLARNLIAGSPLGSPVETKPDSKASMALAFATIAMALIWPWLLLLIGYWIR